MVNLGFLILRKIFSPKIYVLHFLLNINAPKLNSKGEDGSGTQVEYLEQTILPALKFQAGCITTHFF